MSQASNSVFSKAYYSTPFLFGRTGEVQQLDDGSYSITLQNNLFNPFWSHRQVHASASEGSLTAVPYSFFQYLTHTFSVTQNSDLAAANQRLLALQNEIQNPASPVRRQFVEEIHREKKRGSDVLAANLKELCKCFQHGNMHSAEDPFLLKIVNYFLGFFGKPPITPFRYAPIDHNVFIQQAIMPALEMTAQESTATKYFPVLRNNSPFPMPESLTRENLHKLELGLLDRLEFTVDGKDFAITYDQAKSNYLLSYTRSPAAPDFNALYNAKLDTTFRPEPINVTERGLNGNAQMYPLQYEIEYTHAESFFHSLTKYKHSSGTMEMSGNSEYTIPLSQGNLVINLLHRV